MRILYLSTWFPFPPDNGSRIRAYHLIRALGRNHQVTLVAFQAGSNFIETSYAIAELYVDSVHLVPEDPFRYVAIPQLLKFCSPIPVAFWPSKLMRQTVAQVVSLEQWDAVVAVQTSVAGYALQLSGVPRILDVDTSLSYQMYKRYLAQSGSVDRCRAWMSWQKAYQYETRLFRRFQSCLVVSLAEVGHLQRMLASTECRVEMVPNGVDCQHNRPGLAQPGPNTLIYNGALTYGANYDAMQFFLTDIYPLIRQHVPAVSMSISGSTSGVDLAALALDPSVCLTGYVDDIRFPVSEATVCVVPIRQGGGTRLKILEAMALGTPVVATSKGAEGLEVIPDYHILIADDPVDFSNQVVRLLRDKSLHQRLATNARRLVEQRYNWLQISQDFVEMVENVASRQMSQQVFS